MKYCPKCFKNLDKDYNICPICGYEEEFKQGFKESQQDSENDIFSGSVFQILDDMDNPYDYDYSYNDINNPYATKEEKNLHICQNEKLENNEPLLDKSKHICQNDILTSNEEQNEKMQYSSSVRHIEKQQRLNIPNSLEGMAERLMQKNNKIDVNKLKQKNNYNTNYNVNNNTNNNKKVNYDYNQNHIHRNESENVRYAIMKNETAFFIACIILAFVSPILGFIFSGAFYFRTKNKKLFIVLLVICFFTVLPFFLMLMLSLFFR